MDAWAHRPILRSGTILAFDGLAATVGISAALMLGLGLGTPATSALTMRLIVPLVVFVRLAAVCAARLHRWSFRSSSLTDATWLLADNLAVSLLFAVVLRNLPASVLALEFFFSTSAMASFRFGPRLIEGVLLDWQRRGSDATLRTLIVGAGGTGDLLARDLQRSEQSRYLVVGFVDDDRARLGVRVCGRPVLGSIRDLPVLIEQLRVSAVLLAIPTLSAKRIREILRLCSSSKALFKKLPASFSHSDERASAAMLHDLLPEDLLPRDPVAFDYAEIRELVEKRRALVTGAGGTIGGEICRQLAVQGASRLVMVDINENELYLLARRLKEEHPSVEIFTEVADIRDLRRLHDLGREHLPQLVFHAAAHKHVPLMESAPEEAVKNNVFGTVNVALMAREVEAEKLLFISTDKAVNPTSVMGATKRIGEIVVRSLAQGSVTKSTAVRFGNVLGSAGSVVPLFKQQIGRGGPVTITHPDCTRYFMTVSEAVGLVLLAGLGGYGELCVLDMGEPIRISEIAGNLITLAGRIPGAEIPIVYTGLRPGEKLHEELLTEDEEESVAVRARIFVARCKAPPRDLPRMLRELHELAEKGDRAGLLEAIRAIVPTYRWTPGQPAPTLAETCEPLPGRVTRPFTNDARSY